MDRRRITRVLSAAAGGLLGAAFLPAATAFADSYEIIPDGAETYTGLYGLENTAPPAETGSIQGYQEFEVYDTSTNQVVGSFEADESNSTDIAGNYNTELLVTQDLSGTVGTAVGDTPAVGSIIDTYTYAGDEFGYVYSDLTSTTPHTISDTLTSLTYGNFPSFSTFDASDGLSAGPDNTLIDTADTALPAITLAGGDQIVPTSPETVSAISGAAPYDIAVQGTQEFKVVNSAGAEVGTFTGDVTATEDVVGTNTETILVTSDGSSGTVGTAAGDIPPVGSVFGVTDYGDGPTPDVYTDLASTTPGGTDVISDYDATLLGDVGVPTSFDAVSYESDDATIPLDGYNITPTGPETLTGVNGLPPADVAIQGTQTFDIGNGSFDADVTTTGTNVYDETTETLLVTQDVSGPVGTAAGDVPAVGSVIDVANYGFGFETVYSDLISSTGTSVITDTAVTPFGDFAIPTTFDATSGLIADTLGLF
jgi:hypothetical protein